MFGMFFLGALYLQRVLGYDPLQIGFAFLPATLVMGTLSLRYSEPLIMRFGAPNAAVPGHGAGRDRPAPVRPRAGGRQLRRDVLPVDDPPRASASASSFPALMTLAMSGATPEDAGLASGLVNTSAQVGGALGLAVLATLSATRTTTSIAAGQSQASALTERLSPRLPDRRGARGGRASSSRPGHRAGEAAPGRARARSPSPRPSTRTASRSTRTPARSAAPRSGGCALEQHVIAPDPGDLEVPGRDPDPHEAVLLDHSLRAVVVEQGARLDAM